MSNLKFFIHFRIFRSIFFSLPENRIKQKSLKMLIATGATTAAAVMPYRLQSAILRRKKLRRRSNMTLHVPTSMQDVRANRFICALAQTTMDLCRDSSLHGIKHIMADIQELGSSYSR